MSFKTVSWELNEKPNLNKLEVNTSDAPDLVLMEFKGFGVRHLSKVKKTKDNGPRKQNRIKNKICRYLASFKKGIRVKTFPPSLVVENSQEELFDGRHTFEVITTIGFTYYWFALWKIKNSGVEMFDNLTKEQKISICGLRLNSLRDFENTVEDDYIRLIRQIMTDANIPFTSKNIVKFMELAGVYHRYNPGSPSYAKIENAIKSKKTSTNLVFNTSDKELKEFIDREKDDTFKYDNQISSDGYICSIRALNKTAHKRYAADILRTATSNAAKGYKTRVLMFSSSSDDRQIEIERQDIINEVHKQLVSPITWYSNWLNTHSVVKCDYPIPSLQDLGLQIFGAVQIEGETDHILLEPNI